MGLTARLNQNFSEEEKYIVKSIREMMSKKAVSFDEWIKEQNNEVDPKILKISEKIVDL